MLLMEEAGLPPGVINMINAHGPEVGEHLLTRQNLAASTSLALRERSKRCGKPLATTSPDIVNIHASWAKLWKDFIIAHPFADARALAVAIAGWLRIPGTKMFRSESDLRTAKSVDHS